MTRVLLGWPAVSLMAFILFLWKGDNLVLIAGNLKRFSAGRDGFVIENYPKVDFRDYASKESTVIEKLPEEEILEEVPTSKPK
jgi:hypothetical protein